MTFSTFRATLAVGVVSSFASALVPGAAFAQNAPIQAPIQTPLDSTPQPTAPVTSVPLAPVKRSGFSDDEIRALGQGPAFPYSLLDEALSRAVTKTGDVNYNTLQGDDSLNAFVRAVGLADLSQFPVFTEKDDEGKTVKNRESELTFWINAYNGLFLQTVAKSYPIKMVSQVKDLDTAKTHVVGGKNYSFAEMRQLIAERDPRALFALLDGTRSGPRAPQSAFRFSGLGAQLNAAVKAFVDDTTRVTVPDRLGRAVQVSPWLQTVDPYFKTKVGKRKWDGIRTVLASYVSQGGSRRYFGAGDYEVKFLTAETDINDTITAGAISSSS